MAPKKKTKVKKKDIKLSSWVLYVQTTSNNTIVTLCDKSWNKVAWWWTWMHWFKWAKQSTPYAAEVLAKEVLAEWKKYWLERISIIFRWVWLWREGIFKAVNETWVVEIESITENTAIKFGWTKWKRPKRN